MPFMQYKLSPACNSSLSNFTSYLGTISLPFHLYQPPTPQNQPNPCKSHKMDFVNQLTGGNNKDKKQENKEEGSGGFFDKIGNKVNEAAGGGRKSEKDEDMLDKGAHTLSYFPALFRVKGDEG